MRNQIIESVRRKKIVAIVRGLKSESIVGLARALYEGGIENIEVTFNLKQPESYHTTTDGIRSIISAMGDKMHVGAGTVVSPELVRMAREAGAQFIVSPNTDVRVIEETLKLGMVSMPGALTPTEAMLAHEVGADFVKLFPAGSLGPGYVKAVRAPLSHIEFLAVGGVNENNIRAFIDAGCAGAGVGGNLVNKTWIENGEFDKITALARLFVENSK